MRNIRLHSLIMIIISNLLMNCTKIDEEISKNGEITAVGIGSISVEKMDVYTPTIQINATATSSNSFSQTNDNSQTIGYSVTYGATEKINKSKLAATEIAYDLKTGWRYKLIAYDKDGNQADLVTYIRGNIESEKQTLKLITGETYTFVCYSEYNTTNSNNGTIPTLKALTTTNLNTAEIGTLDGGAAFMFWKETHKVTKDLKLRINLRHQFHGYEIRLKAPAGYTFSISNGTATGLGARIYPSVTQVRFKISDLTLTQAIPNSASGNLSLVNTDFTNLMGSDYLTPYTTIGRIIRFVDPDNKTSLLGDNAKFVQELYCDETSMLTIHDQNFPIYTKYKSVIRIQDLRLRKISNNATTSNQTLFIHNIDMKRYKMNRITINLIPPAGF